MNSQTKLVSSNGHGFFLIVTINLNPLINKFNKIKKIQFGIKLSRTNIYIAEQYSLERDFLIKLTFRKKKKNTVTDLV